MEPGKTYREVTATSRASVSDVCACDGPADVLTDEPS